MGRTDIEPAFGQEIWLRTVDMQAMRPYGHDRGTLPTHHSRASGQKNPFYARPLADTSEKDLVCFASCAAVVPFVWRSGESLPRKVSMGRLRRGGL